MENTASTGIDKLKNEKPIKKLNGIDVAIRYECKKCGYICPIKYDMKDSICDKNKFNMPKYSPLYDRSIYEFIKYFGE